MSMKDKTVEELLEVIDDLRDRVVELEGKKEEFLFKEGDIVQIVREDRDPNKMKVIMGSYVKVTRGSHNWLGEKWIDFVYDNGNRRSCYSYMVDLIWRDK